MSESDFRECVDGYLDDFTRYDQYVDVVSCWEEFLSNYRPFFEGYYFDRFPSMRPIGGGDDLSPDFSVLFNDSYGLVFEVSRTLPPDDERFDSEMDQIRSYDQQLLFHTGDSSTTVPERHDIVLLVSTTDSQTIAHRLQSFLNDGRLDLGSNIIPMEYTYLDQDRKAKYQFKRLSHVDQNFRDDVLPNDWQLSKKLSMDGGTFDNIYSPVSAFYENKVTGVLCNDKPPALYLSCYIWHHVFPEIAVNQSAGNLSPRAATQLNIEAEQLKENLVENYIPEATIKTDWVEEALDFLVLAEVADPQTNGDYNVRFRNLRDKRRQFKDVVTERTQIRDLANLFAEWACEN
ncbi:MAG: hypothetical protein ABEI86_13025, partial [Halobacteriaceae archaeon]